MRTSLPMLTRTSTAWAEYTPVTHDYARVKGRTENELLALDRPVFVVRPGFIQPCHCITSRTRIYRYLCSWSAWLFPVLERLAPKYVTTTERLGRAMVALAKHGDEQRLLRSDGINRVAG
ncbi:hypothetical protein V1227_14555 [Lentzea sp. DG1S-22]|uniref:hypothetical protein n=1 Tax=Lentzea sp. DG1S-22 TaxID=3108822 RepID=UPI002E79AD9F|nr:hypothetical protein [Lentzea sp. DG1S-22]WVH83918.1 hypothetical protein V1227_14555 [Lentzea sp. DG1S-22]